MVKIMINQHCSSVRLVSKPPLMKYSSCSTLSDMMMKRKATPFPSSSVCTMVKSAVAPPLPPPLTNGPASTSSSVASLFEDDLILPGSHEFSLTLTAEEAVRELESNRPEGLASWELLTPGLIELIIQSGKIDGYGVRTWPFRIGGVGLLYDGFSAPVAVRCGVPIAHSHIDDAGFVDAIFWTYKVDITQNATLHLIAERLVEFLGSEKNVLLEDRDRRWKESEIHCFEKVSVINKYKAHALNPDLIDINGHVRSEWIAPNLRDIAVSDWGKSVEEISTGVFCFDLFTPEFCDLLVREFDSFESTSLPRRRPNTMNKFGLILNEIGLEPIMSDLLNRFVAPLSAFLYPKEKVAVGLDHHHTFIVVYSEGGDKGLDMHHDASEVTLNVCLGRDFTGAGLVFCGHAGRPDHRRTRHTYGHTKGKAVIHLGRQRHGADDISGGERVNLIMWARSSAFRCAAVNGTVSPDGFPRLAEDGEPDQMCLSRANDGDYTQQMRRIETERIEATKVV